MLATFFGNAIINPHLAVVAWIEIISTVTTVGLLYVAIRSRGPRVFQFRRRVGVRRQTPWELSSVRETSTSLDPLCLLCIARAARAARTSHGVVAEKILNLSRILSLR